MSSGPSFILLENLVFEDLFTTERLKNLNKNNDLS